MDAHLPHSLNTAVPPNEVQGLAPDVALPTAPAPPTQAVPAGQLPQGAPSLKRLTGVKPGQYALQG